MKRILLTLLFSFGALAAKADVIEMRLIPDIEVRTIHTLANVSVGPNLRRFSVRVNNCANDIAHVMLKVANAGLHVSEAGVIYTDGTADSYNISYTFQAGYESPWMSIDSFKSSGKCIRFVFVTAQSTDARVNSHVTVLGNSTL